MLTTTDTKTMAYINLFGVLGTLENLCALDPNAGALLTNKNASFLIGFEVKGARCHDHLQKRALQDGGRR